MPSPQILKRRISSIQNTRQIAKAMELVAASKMRRTQNQTLQSRPYASEGFTIIKDLLAKVDRLSHPLLAHRDLRAMMLIVITSDKGLAGAYNTLLLKEVIKFLSLHNDHQLNVISIGKKGVGVLSKIDSLNLVAIYTNFPIHPTAADVLPIAKEVIDGFSRGKYDSVQIAYTHFHSTVKHEPRIEELLPLRSNADPSNGSSVISNNHIDYSFEPNADIVFDFILPRIIEVQIYQRMLEAIASEQSARMVAMKNASDNASEILDDLQLTYNSARQAKITQELLEIARVGD